MYLQLASLLLFISMGLAAAIAADEILDPSQVSSITPTIPQPTSELPSTTQAPALLSSSFAATLQATAATTTTTTSPTSTATLSTATSTTTTPDPTSASTSASTPSFATSNFTTAPIEQPPSSPPPPPPTAPPLPSSTTSASPNTGLQVLRARSKLFRCSTSTDCQNGGVCFNNSCFCAPGYTGESCAIDVDECRQLVEGEEPCLNGGKCIDEIATFRCECVDGYKGERCKEEVNMCLDSQCLNEAVCINHRTNYTCECQAGWEGRHCEVNVDECSKNPCQNNATCYDMIGDYRCDCGQSGFTGKNCEIDIDECHQLIDGEEPCLNGGRCIDEVASFRCECADGFKGDRCKDEVNMCLDSLCLNHARCINHRTNYTCECQPGWEGQHCEINIDECAKNPCLNNATCYDLVDDYRCDCGQSGFTGKNCEIHACASNPCTMDARKCIDLAGDFKCVCHEGFTGKRCELDIDECQQREPRYCQNGATCENYRGGARCICREGFKGERCQEVSDICKASKPCVTGSCRSLGTLYSCDCPSSHYGHRCEIKRNCLNDCQSKHSQCINNVTCACLPDVQKEERMSCELIANCDSVKGDLCLNGGECKNLEQGGYVCQCRGPYSGSICQFEDKAQFDLIIFIAVICVFFSLAGCIVVSLVFRTVRKARATRGTYSPSTQEKFGNSASDLLKPPQPERLI